MIGGHLFFKITFSIKVSATNEYPKWFSYLILTGEREGCESPALALGN